MKKNKLTKLIIGIIVAVLVIAAAILITSFVRSHKTETLVQQQNYVASKLLELGDYEQGRILAAQCEQMKENDISRQLLVLAAGFQSDYETGIRYAEGYLAKKSDARLSEAKGVLEEFLTSEAALEESTYYEQYEQLKTSTREKLLGLLLQVQNSIDVKKNSANIQAMLDMMSSQSISSETLVELEKDNSMLSQKVQAVYAIQTGDFTKALDKATEAFNSNKTFENRALLANIIAKQGAYLDDQNSKIAKLREELYELQNKLNELNVKYQETASEAEKLKLTNQMEGLENQIQTKKDTIESEPVRRAINFIETTTPVTERDTVAYKIELAQLYYQAKEDEKAKELLVEVIKETDDDTIEPTAMLMEDFVTFYQMKNGQIDKPAYFDMENITIDIIWNRITELLNFVDNGYYYYGAGDNFYQFMLDVLDALYNGLIIREIDATDFPVVRVTVNVAMELEEKLKKSNFSIMEMNSPISDFQILDEAEIEKDEEMSVVLVVDRSGSMSGSPLEDTKKAVANFVKSVEDDIRIGLVAFDDRAEVVAPISDNRTPILQGINSIYDGGGTSIYLGLQQAGIELEGESGKKIVILLSDGADGDASRIDAVLEDLKRKNIYVYTIGFGGADTEYLSYIATSCGGKFIQADSSEVLGEIYSAIGEYMVNDYIIQFTVVMDPDNYSRVVNVSVDVNDAFAEREYHVGVPYEDIENETGETPLADYFWQIGGSWMGETP
ncbi:MAG: VWA domain-containing protein [Lachnospiraceae bacterium]|nr:VWA domain-containing protein [Lachnospiraceae bacterium]